MIVPAKIIRSLAAPRDEENWKKNENCYNLLIVKSFSPVAYKELFQWALSTWNFIFYVKSVLWKNGIIASDVKFDEAYVHLSERYVHLAGWYVHLLFVQMFTSQTRDIPSFFMQLSSGEELPDAHTLSDRYPYDVQWTSLFFRLILEHVDKNWNFKLASMMFPVSNKHGLW